MVYAVSNPPFRLYSWTIFKAIGDPPELGAVGVCDDQGRALTRMSEALREAPAGAQGLVHKVTCNPVKLAYWYDDLVARAQVNPSTGAVEVAERHPTEGWGRLGDVFAEMAEACADTPPPEALSAGLADLETAAEQRRRLP